MNRCENYQKTGSKWFGEIPKHWGIKRLKYLAKLMSETRLSVDGDIKISLENVESKTGRIINYYSDYEGEGLVLRPGDILFNTLRVYLNKVAFCNFDGLLMSRGSAIAIRPATINGEFLHWVLSSSGYIDHANSFSKGSTRPTSSKSDILGTFIPVPSFEEQQLISRYLDKKISRIDSMTKKLQKKIELLNEQRSSSINQCVTKGLNSNAEMKDSGVEWIGKIPKHWKISKIKWITTKIGSGVTPSGGGDVYSETGIPLLRSQNIHFDGLHLDDVVFISEEIDQIMSASRVQKNDVLYNITGVGTSGRCCLVEAEEKMNVNQHVCIVRPSKNVFPKYLLAVLSSNLGQRQLRMKETGSGREGLNFENLGNFLILIMDIHEQIEIGEKVMKLNQVFFELESKLKTKIKTLNEYRQSLITSVVTGKVRVTEDMV